MERILKICSLGFIILFQYWLFAGGGGGGATLVTPPAGMPACVPNTAPGETSCTATPICDFNGYCGTTLGSYAADARNTPIQTAFESCLGRGVSIDNDSYLSFVASATSVTFDIYVYNCNTDQCIQLFMFSRTDCGSGTVTGHQCAYQLFARNNSYAVSVSGLTVGQTYYILIDGCSGNICDYTFVAQSGVVAPLAVNIPNNAAVCSGSNVTVTASGGLGSYTWSGASGLSATSGSTVTITPPATPGTYNYKVTASGGTAMCPQSLEHDFSIVVSGLPTITGNTTLCVGETSDLNATGEWAALPTGGTITTVGNERIHRFTSNGTFTTTNPINSARYLVVGGGGGACGDVGGGAGGGGVRQGISSAPSGSNAVVVGAGGAGAAAGNSNSGNAQNGGNSSVFGIIAQGGGRGGNYQGAGANGATGGGGGGGGVTAGGTGIAGQGYAGGSGATGSSPYKSGGGGGAGGIGGSASSSAGGNGGNGIASDISGTLTYYGGGGGGGCGDGGTPGTGGLGGGGNGKNRATNSPGNNGTANTGGGGGGNAHPHYGGASGGSGIVFVRYRPPVWTSSNTAVATVNSMTGVVTAVSSGTSNITFTNEHGCSSSTTITVNPSNLTPVFTNPGPICSGAALSLPTTSNNSITGTWSPAVNNTTTTTYTFTPAAGQCSAVTTTMTVTVNPLVTPTFNNPGPICSGTALTLPTTSNNSITGTWSPAVNNTATTTYTFTPTAGQCAATTTMTVTVNPLVTPTFTNPGPICSGATLTLPTTSNNSIAGTWSPAVNNTTTTTYTFTPTAGQCAATTTMTVTVNPLVTPTFNNPGPICSGDALTLPTTSNNSIAGTWSPTVNNTATTTYTFTPTAGQCAATTTMTVTVNPLVTPTFNNPGPICSGDALTLPTTSNNSIAGTWSPAVNNTATTTYTFTPTAGQCAATTTMTVTVTPLVTPTFNNPGPICSGVALTLPTTSNNSITGTWSPAVNNTATTTYTFTPTAGQCAATTTMTVTVNPLVTPTFNNPGPICSGATLTLPTTSSNSIAGTWSPAVNNTATTTYTFTPTAGQCAATTTMTVTVNNQTVPTFTNPGSICSGTTLTLSTTSNNGITGTWSPAVNNTATTTYTFAPDAGQCAATTTMTVTVTPLVTPTFTNPGPICSGVALTLPTTSNNGITGTWSPAVNNTATTTYTFAPDAGQCATSETMTVTVTPLVTPTFNNPGPICSGATLTLPTTSSNSIAGTWSPAVNNTATTTYTFTPTAGQCATTTTMTVTVNPLVTPTFNNPGPICSGSTLTLATTSNNGVTGTWTPAVNNTATTTYTFAPDAGQCATSETMIVTVNPKIIPTFTNPGPICSGSPLTLATTSNNGVTGTWTPTPNNTTTTTYTFTPNTGECSLTETMTITVNPLPTTSISGSTTVCQQGTSPVVTFTGSGGTAPYTFTYTINGGAAQTVTSTGNTATVSVPTTTAGTFTYALTGVSESSVTACSNPATGSVSIVVNPKPVVTLNAAAASICSGSGVSITPASTPAGATFSWTAANNNTSGANSGTGTIIAENLIATATAAGTATYTVTGTLNGCTSDPANSVITVNPMPVASAQGQTICSGTSTNLALNSNIPGTTFSWTVAPSGVSGASNGSGSSINQMLTSLTGGSVTYTITPTAGNCSATPPISVVVDVQAMPAIAVTPANSSICQGDQVTLTATGGVTYTWTPSTGLSATTGATVTATPSATTTYIVTGASSAGCTGTSQTVVTVNNYPNVTISSDIPVSPNVTVCLGTPVTLTASGAATYTWSPATGLTSASGAVVTANPSTTTTYTVSATSNGCTSTESVTITVNPIPVVSAGPDITVCKGSKVTLNATGAVSYSWSDGVTNLVPFTADTTRTYTVTGTSEHGCTNTDYITVFVTEAPEVAFTAGRITGCVPLHIQFENLSQGATSYAWSFGDGTTSTLEDAFHDYEQNGCFDVTLTAYNTYGCSTAVKMDSMICTLPSPTAAFVASTYEITNVINEVQFNNMSEGATSYQWYFGDETGYSTKEHPKYTYDPNIFRNYNVMLVATNQDGCTDTARVVIRMSEDVVFYVPNSFTPDGDNFNNVFKPVFVEGFDAFEYEMLIFNRWGEVIFETHDVNYGWDGTYLFNGGKLCPDGTYVWKINVKKTGVDDRVEKTGSVTLVR